MRERHAREVRARLDAEDVADVRRQLEERAHAARRHTLWALIGISPAGLVPMVATASEFGVAALILGSILISGIEATRAIRARSEAMALREQLHRLTSEWTSSSTRSEM